MRKMRLNIRSIQSKKMLLVFGFVFLLLYIFEYQDADNKEKWLTNPKIRYYGEIFQEQDELQSIARYDSGYIFKLANGDRVIVVSKENKYQLNRHDNNYNVYSDIENLNLLLVLVNIDKETYDFWTNAIEELDTYEVSKVAFSWCENTLISDYKKAPFFDSPARGWFYFKNDKSCINSDVYLNENRYFHSIEKITDEWYFAIEK